VLVVQEVDVVRQCVVDEVAREVLQEVEVVSVPAVVAVREVVVSREVAVEDSHPVEEVVSEDVDHRLCYFLFVCGVW
jgi:hypothetical protein